MTDPRQNEGLVQRLRRWKMDPAPAARDAGLLSLRVGVGLLMLTQHGWPKLMSWSQKAATWADPIGLGPQLSLALAIGAELVCAAFVVVGLGTRGAAIPLVITMLVAAFVVHWDDPFAKKEFALMYLVPFLALILTGAGRWSVDGWWARRRTASHG